MCSVLTFVGVHNLGRESSKQAGRYNVDITKVVGGWVLSEYGEGAPTFISEVV